MTCLRECKQPSICTQYHTSYCFKQLDKSIKIWYWLIDYSSSFVTIISVSSAVSRPTTTTCPPVNLDGLLVSTVLSNQQHQVSISWLTEQLLTSPPTQYRLSGRCKLTGQKTQPTVSKYWRKRCYKSKENPEKSKQHKIQQYNKQTHTTILLWVTRGWLPQRAGSPSGTPHHVNRERRVTCT